MCLRSGFLEAEPEIQILVQVIYEGGSGGTEQGRKGGLGGQWFLDWQCQHHVSEIHIPRSDSGTLNQELRGVGQLSLA